MDMCFQVQTIFASIMYVTQSKLIDWKISKHLFPVVHTEVSCAMVVDLLSLKMKVRLILLKLPKIY